MRLTDVSVDHAGVLENIRFTEIPGLTLIYGGNGSGKTTLQQFLRDTLLSIDGRPDAASAATAVGCLVVSDGSSRWDIARTTSPDGTHRTQVLRRDDPDWSGSLRARFPAWVTDEVFAEVFFPGHVEADRFDLLTRLCLETDAAGDEELERADRAVRLAVQEREGSATQRGVVRQIEDFEHERDTILEKLRCLRRQDPAVPQAIADLERRINALHSVGEQLDRECARIRISLAGIEERLTQDTHHNRLPLITDGIRKRMAELTTRLNRWTEICTALERETQRLPTAREPGSLRLSHSVRAIISRLEDRMQEGCDDSAQWRRGLETEVAALCCTADEFQATATQVESSLESLLVRQALQAAQQMTTLIGAQVAALGDELARADDLLDPAHHHVPSQCVSAWHSQLPFASRLSDESPKALERERTNLHQRLHELQGQRTAHDEDVRRLEIERDELRRGWSDSESLEQIDELKSRLAETEARIELLISHRDVLVRTESALREVAKRLRERQEPAALQLASSWIRQVTAGECRRIFADTARTRLLVETSRSATPLALSQLSRGTRHQLALVLRLALLQARSATSGRLPLVIDDVFITSDDERGTASADLLRTAAADGQQIILLTCQNDVRTLLAARGARVFHLAEQTRTAEQEPAPAPVTPPERPVTEGDSSLVYKAFTGVAEEFPGEMQDVVFEDSEPQWLFYLEPEHSVSDLAGITDDEVAALQQIGVELIDDLLLINLREADGQLRAAGGNLNEHRLRDLRSQARMVVGIPMLRQRDAELLVAAGVQTVHQLARLRPEAVYELVIRFQTSEAGRRFLRGGHSIDRQQAINWNRWALHARTEDQARSQARLRSRKPTEAASSAWDRRPRDSRPDQSARRRIHSRLPDERRQELETRPSRRRDRRTRSTEDRHDGPQSSIRSRRRFYLSRSSAVEEAPSIGPKTASRLARVNVKTVDDLLECDPETIATLIDNRGITADVIRAWQDQARLVCTVPQLRGHDAQILVACSHRTPESIAEESPEELLAIVQPFCESTEGLRIIRGGRQPDLEEVREWISRARESRPLRAA